MHATKIMSKTQYNNVITEVNYKILLIRQQGVIQVEGENEKSNQKMLLKKGQLLFQYPAMDTQS